MSLFKDCYQYCLGDKPDFSLIICKAEIEECGKGICQKSPQN